MRDKCRVSPIGWLEVTSRRNRWDTEQPPSVYIGLNSAPFQVTFKASGGLAGTADSYQVAATPTESSSGLISQEGPKVACCSCFPESDAIAKAFRIPRRAIGSPTPGCYRGKGRCGFLGVFIFFLGLKSLPPLLLCQFAGGADKTAGKKKK